MPPATKESFAKSLEGLVKKFDADKETYLSSGYGEAQARSHFITPFFKALGWDVENEAAVPFHLCDVWEEKGETTGRPDYTFRINGETKLFVEAKAPSVQLGSAAAVLQTKTYAWNSRDVLFAGLTTVAAFFLRTKLYPGKLPWLPATGVTNDVFALVLRKPAAEETHQRALALLTECGAASVTESEADL